ncbi:helix-turn-helix transcriptional regulator [Kitasatospora sp. RB6PN24]|uniref:response regulator transcription factor n=1 Tax=Kitasatospora humi TaxID=2893891 RepID=UPI001E573A02|nr:helix-turn-helix transcriptional regulator [Kitasatospora humi]MCC9308324.1 helix-turn-helix transcriptional regulator [Kitasatospora humi]
MAALRGRADCRSCGAQLSPVAALAEAVDRMHVVLSEVRSALDVQEKVIESLLTEAEAEAEEEGDRESLAGTPAVGLDPTCCEALSLLTAREREVLLLVARGNSNRRVATSLGISEKTVKNHLSAVFSKLGASDRTHAVVMGIRGGVVAIGEDYGDALRSAAADGSGHLNEPCCQGTEPAGR